MEKLCPKEGFALPFPCAGPAQGDLLGALCQVKYIGAASDQQDFKYRSMGFLALELNFTEPF